MNVTFYYVTFWRGGEFTPLHLGYRRKKKTATFPLHEPVVKTQTAVLKSAIFVWNNEMMKTRRAGRLFVWNPLLHLTNNLPASLTTFKVGTVPSFQPHPLDVLLKLVVGGPTGQKEDLLRALTLLPHSWPVRASLWLQTVPITNWLTHLIFQIPSAAVCCRPGWWKWWF